MAICSKLVYDISRCGRFQDVDESAHYGYVLKRAGVCTDYFAENFSDDASLSSVLLQMVNRAMAENIAASFWRRYVRDSAV
jgi:hypothetical protein